MRFAVPLSVVRPLAHMTPQAVPVSGLPLPPYLIAPPRKWIPIGSICRLPREMEIWADSDHSYFPPCLLRAR